MPGAPHQTPQDIAICGDGGWIVTEPHPSGSGTVAHCEWPSPDVSPYPFGWRRPTPAEMAGGRRGRRMVQHGRLAARNQAAKILEPGITGARTAAYGGLTGASAKSAMAVRRYELLGRARAAKVSRAIVAARHRR